MMEKINGHNFAERVLHDPQGNVEGLLRFSGNDESCWLELKAGMTLLSEDVKRGDKPQDLYWNIAKAIIEIANTSGGILLIGIDDKNHNAVALEENDPRKVIEKNGLEAYRRKEIIEKIWPEKKEWRCCDNKVKWHIEENIPADLVSVLGWEYQGKNIAVVLIKPANECIKVWKNDETEMILARYPGEIGKKLDIKGSKRIIEFENRREIDSEYFALLYQKFCTEAAKTSNNAIIEQKIKDYYASFDEKMRKRQLFDISQFTSLDATGEIKENDDDFMEPEAFEIDMFESDKWLDEKEYAEEDDDDIAYEDEENINSEDDEDRFDTRIFQHRSGDLISLMQEIPRMIILGEPGGGKTTTLIKFTTLFSESETLAVFIPMGQWKKGGSLEALISSITGLESEQWIFLIKENRLRLVIDAVNECPDQFRQAALLDVENFLLRHSGVPTVISARTDADLKKFKLPFFSVQKMNEKHQLDYLTKYLVDEGKAQEVFDKLKSISGGSEIASNPMLLRLVVEVFKKQNEIPNGRAELYHKWLEQWYKREYGKAKTAGDSLQWNFETVLDILSELALQSRLLGYRDVPIDMAKEILRQYDDDCIVKLCQGPVVTIDEEFVRFRHETFQEYLCAEKLIRYPNLLTLDSRKAEENSIQWGMPLAYAVELSWPLPETLWRAAWAIDPWFGVAVTDNERSKALLSGSNEIAMPEYNGRILNFAETTDDLTLLIHSALTEDYKNISKLLQIRTLWYKNSQFFSYIISVNEEIKHKWEILEFEQLICCWNIYLLLAVIKRAFTLKVKRDLSPDVPLMQRIQINEVLLKDNKRWLCYKNKLLKKKIRIPSNIRVSVILDAINCGIFKKDDFADKIEQWVESSTPTAAKHLIDCGLATKEDFSDRVEQWIADVAKPHDVRALINCGLAAKEDFADKIVQWIADVTKPRDVRALINCGLVTKEDLAEKVKQWIDTATPTIAKCLIHSEVATKEDFAEKVKQWIDTATPLSAKHLIDCGVATKKDFSDKISKWITEATPKTARNMIHYGLAAKEDFADKIKHWISVATPRDARGMIHCGLATKEDFADRVEQWLQWIRDDSFIHLSVMLKSKLINIEDIAYNVLLWRLTGRKGLPKILDKFPNTLLFFYLSKEQARHLMRKNLATGYDFPMLFKYYTEMLQNADDRKKISLELTDKFFDMEVEDKNSTDHICFIHQDFSRHIFYSLDSHKGKIPQHGEIWSVKLGIIFHEELQKFVFTVKECFLKEEITGKDVAYAELDCENCIHDRNTMGISDKQNENTFETSDMLASVEFAGNDQPTDKERNNISEFVSYSGVNLQDSLRRNQIISELRDKSFVMKVDLNINNAFMFLSCPEFAEQIYCNGKNFNQQKPQAGEVWSMKVAVILRKKENIYSFTCINGTLLKETDTVEQVDASKKSDFPMELVKISQRMLAAKDEETFKSVIPDDWHISFDWIKANHVSFGQITNLCQAVTNRYCTKERRERKLSELKKCLAEHSEFDWVQQKLSAAGVWQTVTNKISAAQSLSQKFSGDAVPVSSPSSFSSKIVRGKDYNPTINILSEYEGLSGNTFAEKASHIRIYIDETWPGNQDPEYKDIGVICGLVWEGNCVDYNILPHIKTHLREQNSPNELRLALKNLTSCRRTLPFIFPIFKNDVKQNDYPQMLRIALILLLGWILPQKGPQCDVKIFCEGIHSSELPEDLNIAGRFMEMVTALQLTKNRFTRWTISEFISKSSKNKNFEYIPYADVIGYTAVPTVKSQKWCNKIIQPESLLGYVPLSPSLLQELSALDSCSADGYAEAIMQFATDKYRTKLFAHIIHEAVIKAKKDSELKNALWSKLEDMFEKKERDMKMLNAVSKLLVKEFPISEFDKLPKQKLIRILVELQNANHCGNPEKVQQCVEMYQACRKQLLEHCLELCVYADMNLAVHFNDRFEFANAAKICRIWENETAFKFLSPENKGRILSSIGQSYALEKDYIKANSYFTQALKIFRDTEENLIFQSDQTSVYMAFNILDSGYYDIAAQAAEVVFGCSFPEAIKKYALSGEKAFHHHLLVKNLYLNPKLQYLQDEYLSYETQWQSNEQHPWELIALYRMLMVKNKDKQQEYFDKLNVLYKEMSSGTTLLLLQAFAWSVYSTVCNGVIDMNNLKKMLFDVEKQLPETTKYCKQIADIVFNNGLHNGIWHILPFNYQ